MREQSESILGCIFDRATLRSPSTESLFLPFVLMAVIAEKAVSQMWVDAKGIKIIPAMRESSPYSLSRDSQQSVRGMLLNLICSDRSLVKS